MNFDGIDFAGKSKVRNIVSAVDSADLAALYNALRGADDSLRKNLIVFLIRNPRSGWKEAINILTGTVDAMAAIRAASVWLALNNSESEK